METRIIEQKPETKGQAFIKYALARLKNDHAFGAALRRADNPAMEYQAWEYLVDWCDITKEWERLPYALVGAAVARAKPDADGQFSLGKAITGCYDDGNRADSAKAKLRRVLACITIGEVCTILRPLLSLINSRNVRISYAKLLDDLRFFNEKTKLKWASDFYGRRSDNDSFGI